MSATVYTPFQKISKVFREYFEHYQRFSTKSWQRFRIRCKYKIFFGFCRAEEISFRFRRSYKTLIGLEIMALFLQHTMSGSTSVPMEQITSHYSSKKLSEERCEEIVTQTIYAKLKQVRSIIVNELFLKLSMT